MHPKKRSDWEKTTGEGGEAMGQTLCGDLPGEEAARTLALNRGNRGSERPMGVDLKGRRSRHRDSLTFIGRPKNEGCIA